MHYYIPYNLFILLKVAQYFAEQTTNEFFSLNNFFFVKLSLVNIIIN